MPFLEGVALLSSIRCFRRQGANVWLREESGPWLPSAVSAVVRQRPASPIQLKNYTPAVQQAIHLVYCFTSWNLSLSPRLLLVLWLFRDHNNTAAQFQSVSSLFFCACLHMSLCSLSLVPVCKLSLPLSHTHTLSCHRRNLENSLLSLYHALNSPPAPWRLQPCARLRTLPPNTTCGVLALKKANEPCWFKVLKTKNETRNNS